MLFDRFLLHQEATKLIVSSYGQCNISVLPFCVHGSERSRRSVGVCVCRAACTLTWDNAAIAVNEKVKQ